MRTPLTLTGLMLLAQVGHDASTSSSGNGGIHFADQSKARALTCPFVRPRANAAPTSFSKRSCRPPSATPGPGHVARSRSSSIVKVRRWREDRSEVPGSLFCSVLAPGHGAFLVAMATSHGGASAISARSKGTSHCSPCRRCDSSEAREHSHRCWLEHQTGRPPNLGSVSDIRVLSGVLK